MCGGTVPQAGSRVTAPMHASTQHMGVSCQGGRCCLPVDGHAGAAQAGCWTANLQANVWLCIAHALWGSQACCLQATSRRSLPGAPRLHALHTNHGRRRNPSLATKSAPRPMQCQTSSCGQSIGAKLTALPSTRALRQTAPHVVLPVNAPLPRWCYQLQLSHLQKHPLILPRGPCMSGHVCATRQPVWVHAQSSKFMPVATRRPPCAH